MAVVNRDGTGFRTLTSDDPWDIAPAWSPDGSTIAFMTKVQGNWDVAVMDPSGGNMRLLTATPGDEGPPIWTPDGKALVYIFANTNHQLVTMRVEKLLAGS